MVADCKPLNKSRSVIYTPSTKSKRRGGRECFQGVLNGFNCCSLDTNFKARGAKFAANWISLPSPTAKKTKSICIQLVLRGEREVMEKQIERFLSSPFKSQYLE